MNVGDPEKLKLLLIVGLATIISAACGAAKIPPGTDFNCPDGTPRIKVDCASIASLKGRVVSANLGIPKVGLGFGGSYDEQALEQISSATQQLAVTLDAQCEQYNACAIDAATWNENQQRIMQHLAFVEQMSATPDAVLGDALWSNAVPELEAKRLHLEYRLEAHGSNETEFQNHESGEALTSGDKMRFVVRVNRKAYIYILLLASQGEVSQLFPMPGIQLRNPIPAGETNTIPDASSAAVFTLDEVTGREHIQILASTEPLSDVEQRLAQMADSAESSGKDVLTSIGRLLCDGDKVRTRGIKLTKSSAACGQIVTRGIQLKKLAGTAVTKTGEQLSKLNARPNDNIIVYQHEIDHQ